MKRVWVLMVLVMLIAFSFTAYSLNNFNYKGIALDNVGQILPATTVDVQITISTTSGGISYQETHSSVTTDQFGGFVVEVGAGSTTGSLTGITTTAETRIKAETRVGGGVWVLSTMESLSDAMDNTLNEIGNYGWALTGNSGTTAGTNFLGTTDDEELRLEVRNGGTVKHSLRMNTNRAIFRECVIPGIVQKGNARGQYAVDMQIYRFAATQIASGDFSAIGGGERNTASGVISTIGGGDNNNATEPYSTIGGGWNSTASGNSSTVGGGYTNTASNSYSTVSGGTQNTASGSSATVGGGIDNTASGDYSTVGGGDENTVGGDYSTVGGGRNNLVNGNYTTVGGGWHHTVSGDYSTIAGGSQNLTSNIYSTVGGGNLNFARAGYSTIGGGYNNQVTGGFSTIAGGLQAVADKYGQNAYASGRFSSNGDAQTSVFVVRNETTDGTATVLYLDGATEQMTIPANTTWVFRVLVGARNADGSANSASWEIKGMLDDNNLISTTTTAISNGPGWPNPTVMITGNNMQVQVQGAAGTTIRWVARVEVVEIGR